MAADFATVYLRSIVCFLVLTVFSSSLTAQDDALLRPFKEDREIADTRQYPYSSIGRLNAGGRSHCTATLIANNKILTAAHCLYYHARKRWYLPSEVDFLLGYQRGDFINHRGIIQIYRNPDYQPSRSNLKNIKSDWAILTLVSPLDASLSIIPLTFANEQVVDPETPIIQAGYHRRRPHVLSVNNDCTIEKQQEDIILHTCWIGAGDSGSPLLSKKGNSYYIVGMNTSIIGRNSDTASMAIALPAHILKQALSYDQP